MIQRPVIASGLVQVPPTRMVLPGGYTQPPLRPVIAGITTVDSGAAPYVGPLDGYTTDLKQANSIARRLLSSYTGPLIRVRRDADNAEDDIPYDSSGNLDQAYLVAFASGGECKVTTVYGQSVNHADMVQTNAALQPSIVDNTGTVRVNNLGYPIAAIVGGETFTSAFAAPLTWPFSIYSNAKSVSDGNYRIIWGLENIGRWAGKTNVDTFYAQGGVSSTFTVDTLNQMFAYILAVAAASDQMSVNVATPQTGGVGTSGTNSAGVQWCDIYGGGAGWSGNVCEFVLYNADHTGATFDAIQTALTLT